MKVDEITPPRKYSVRSVAISHCANIHLDPEELVTFTTDSGKEYDVMKKSWGFFATPSINNRLKNFGYKTALIRDSSGKKFICLVEVGREDEFLQYVEEDAGKIECWLSDDPRAVNEITHL
jgi:hypothetical protein